MPPRPPFHGDQFHIHALPSTTFYNIPDCYHYLLGYKSHLNINCTAKKIHNNYILHDSPMQGHKYYFYHFLVKEHLCQTSMYCHVTWGIEKQTIQWLTNALNMTICVDFYMGLSYISQSPSFLHSLLNQLLTKIPLHTSILRSKHDQSRAALEATSFSKKVMKLQLCNSKWSMLPHLLIDRYWHCIINI